MITPKMVSTDGVYTPAKVPKLLIDSFITKSTLDAPAEKVIHLIHYHPTMVRFVFKVNSMQEDLTHFFNDLNVVELSSVLADPR